MTDDDPPQPQPQPLPGPAASAAEGLSGDGLTAASGEAAAGAPTGRGDSVASGMASVAVRTASEGERTGDDRVDAALDRLADLQTLPLAAQVTVFDDVHRLLQDALTASDLEVAADLPGAPVR